MSEQDVSLLDLAPEFGSDDPSSAPVSDPTVDTYGDLQRAFAHFNTTLFNGSLKPCLITLRAKGAYGGYFSPDRFVHPDGRTTHEIALNVELYGTNTIEFCLSILVHEMAHQAQHEDGTASRRTYHNRAYAKLMRSVGLPTSATGRPGGAEVGERMSHYIDPEGPFLAACRVLVDEGFRARWADRFITRLAYEYVAPKDAEEQGMPPASSDIEDEVAPSPPSPPAPSPTPPPKRHEGGEPAFVEKSPEVFRRNVAAKRSVASKTKFLCPKCEAAVWGKPTSSVICGECYDRLVPAPLKGVRLSSSD